MISSTKLVNATTTFFSTSKSLPTLPFTFSAAGAGDGPQYVDIPLDNEASEDDELHDDSLHAASDEDVEGDDLSDHLEQ